VRSAGGGQVAASASQCGPAVTGGALVERDGEKTDSEEGENRSACESESACGRRRSGESEGDSRFKASRDVVGDGDELNFGRGARRLGLELGLGLREWMCRSGCEGIEQLRASVCRR
jgi:hypothetical protein